ncbi:Ada metal-binding domain-containing protein [Erysipelotrichaceae bacterium 51-3]
MNRFKRFTTSLIASASTLMALAAPAAIVGQEATSITLEDTGSVEMYRVYNPNSGEHFYTGNSAERDSLVSKGWKNEGTGWISPTEGDDVYRLYSPATGDHHYTTNAAERDALTSAGWKYEGVSWKSGGDIPAYRVFNPNASGAGSHHYTTSQTEAQSLVSAGWKDEQIGWMVKGYGEPVSWNNGNSGSNSSNPSTPDNPGTPNTPGNMNAYGLREVSADQANYVVNTHTGKFHHPNCGHAHKMQSRNRFYTNSTSAAIQNAGFCPCQVCKP